MNLYKTGEKRITNICNTIIKKKRIKANTVSVKTVIFGSIYNSQIIDTF